MTCPSDGQARLASRLALEPRARVAATRADRLSRRQAVMRDLFRNLGACLGTLQQGTQISAKSGPPAALAWDPAGPVLSPTPGVRPAHSPQVRR